MPVQHRLCRRHCQCWPVALAAQVAQIKVAQLRGHDLRDGFGCRVVGKMAMAAGYALLEAPGPRRILQHFQVVIGFQHQHVGRANPFHDQSRCMAQIGQKTDVSAWRSQQKTNRVLGIMRDHESFHADIAHLEASPGAE